MGVVNVSEAKATLSKLLAEVEAGQRVVIGRAGRPVAVLVAYEEDPTPRSLTPPWRDEVAIADDFDELPDDLRTAFEA